MTTRTVTQNIVCSQIRIETSTQLEVYDLGPHTGRDQVCSGTPDAPAMTTPDVSHRVEVSS